MAKVLTCLFGVVLSGSLLKLFHTGKLNRSGSLIGRSEPRPLHSAECGTVAYLSDCAESSRDCCVSLFAGSHQSGFLTALKDSPARYPFCLQLCYFFIPVCAFFFNLPLLLTCSRITAGHGPTCPALFWSQSICMTRLFKAVSSRRRRCQLSLLHNCYASD